MKKNLLNKATALLLSALMLFSMTVQAFAAGAGDEPVITEKTVTYPGSSDNEGLFDQYVEGLFYGGGAQTYAARLARDTLDSKAAAVYDAFKSKIMSVADGTLSSTVFEGMTFSFSVQSDNEYFELAMKAVDALLEDCPSELYWFDKTVGTDYRLSYNGVSYMLTAKMAVVEGYQKNGDLYTVDTTAVERAKKAVANAQNIVSKAPSGTADKLKYFKDKICEMVDYDFDATSDDAPYGDSFQLVNVFDGVASTKVVCEGYSKAFQYLCELADIDCYTVTGMMYGGTGAGPHMWNIVRLDGKSYVVDVTNCDSGSIGYPDLLCLKGVTPVSGGYEIAGCTYAYDKETTSLLSSSVTTPSTLDYGEKPHEHTFSAEWTKDETNHWHAATCEHKTEVSGKEAHKWDEGKVTTQPTETSTGVKTYTCDTCNATKTEVLEKLPHTHTFSSEWTKDETNHWHAATCEHKTEVSGKEAHKWDEGKVTTEPTETSTGVKTYTCDTCNAAKTEVLEKLPHTHTFSNEWTKDETNHWHAATCEHKTEVSGKEAHKWDEGIVTTQPTETSTGVKTYTCDTCNATKTEVLEKLPHTHTFSDEWSKDDTNHWHAATCEHKTEVSGKEAHKWDEGKVTTPATEAAKGVKTYTCTVCSATKTEEIPQLEHTHTFSNEWTKDETNHWHAATCEHKTEVSGKEAHKWDEGKVTTEPTETTTGVKTYTCDTCNAAKTEVIEKLPHTHTFSNEWTKDETNHWHAATCEHKTEVADKEAHKWDEGKVTTPATEAAKGIKTYTCTVCSATKTEDIPQLEHTHTFSNEWSKDDTYHWHAATCEHKTEVSGKEAHKWDEGKVTTEPTETTTGVKTYTCDTCNATKTEVIEKLPHTHNPSADWSHDDVNHWHTCSRCDEKLDSAAHAWGAGVETKPATETDEGEMTFTCTVCLRTKTLPIEKLPHTHKFSADWSHDDNNHWHDATCEHKTEVSEKAPHSWGAGVVTTQPTESSTGVKTYTCTVCKAAKTEVIEKLAHTHKPSENWIFDATGHWHICSGCKEKVDFASHAWDNGVVTTPATEILQGVKTFTCTVCKATKQEIIPTLQHVHKPVNNEWSSDESSHWHVCTGCDVKIDYAPHMWDAGRPVTRAARAGDTEMLYTCTVCARTKTVIIPAPEHVHVFEYVKGVPSTCAKKGVAEHYHCTECGKDFSDSAAQHEISDTTLPLDHSNHAYATERREVKVANCCEPGYTGDLYCKGCNTILSYGTKTAVDPESHRYEYGKCRFCGIPQNPYSISDPIYLSDEYHIVNGITSKHKPSRHGLYTDGIYEWYKCVICDHEYNRKPVEIQNIEVNDPDGDTVDLVADDPVESSNAEPISAGTTGGSGANARNHSSAMHIRPAALTGPENKLRGSRRADR